LTFALTGAAWSRVLTTLGEAGLFDASLPSSDHLLETLATLEIADISPLEVGAGDLLPVEGIAPQAAVAGQAAVQARRASGGRGGAPARPAQAAVPARSALAGRRSRLLLSRHRGALGGPECSSPVGAPGPNLATARGLPPAQVERNRVGGDVRAAGRLFRQAIATRFSQSMDNAVLAQHMGEYLDELGSGLPAALRDEPLTPRLCLNALRDALSYREGGQEARRVEERRYRHVAPLAPNLFNQALPLSLRRLRGRKRSR